MPELIPFRWPVQWTSPSKLELIKGTPINCLTGEAPPPFPLGELKFVKLDPEQPPEGVTIREGVWPRVLPSEKKDAAEAGPTGSPWVRSSWVSNRSSAWTWVASVTLGSTITSRWAPAAETTSITSVWVHGVVQSFTRTPRSWPAQPGPASAAATWVRARALASGATASSRSRNTSSAGRPLAFSIIFRLLPGTERQVLRGR